MLERRHLLGAAALGLLALGTAPAAPAAPAASPAGLPALVRSAKPAVLLVGTYAETDSPRFAFRGTGFAVGNGQRIVTAAHVLPEPTAAGDEEGSARRLVVMAWQGGTRWEQREVSVKAVSRPTDLAVLELQGAPLATALSLGPREPVAEGSEIALIGFPIGGLLGFSHVTHRGVVSAFTPLVPPQLGSRTLTAAAIRQLRDAAIDIYQLDALAYPGNSGGPVIELASGQVIGVLSMGLTRGGREGALSAPTGISYAIPVQHVHELLSR